MTTLETVPTVWDSERDETFRITARLLPSAFVEAASALLASYDDEASAPDARSYGSGVRERLVTGDVSASCG